MNTKFKLHTELAPISPWRDTAPCVLTSPKALIILSFLFLGAPCPKIDEENIVSNNSLSREILPIENLLISRFPNTLTIYHHTSHPDMS